MILYKNLPYTQGPIYGDIWYNICDCVNANNPQSFQDHADPKWDYFTYATDQTGGGYDDHPTLPVPNIQPDWPIDKRNQVYGIFPNGINSNCWINDFLPAGKRPNLNGINVTTRSFGADYFTPYPGGMFAFFVGSGYETRRDKFNIACNGNFENITKKIGQWVGSTPPAIAISPRHVLMCRHCYNINCYNEETQYVYLNFYNENSNSFESFEVEIIKDMCDPLNGADALLGKIIDSDTREFPHYYRQIVEPTFLPVTETNDTFLAFARNNQGLFFVFETNSTYIGFISPLSDHQKSYSGIVPRVELTQTVTQPKAFDVIPGHSGTHFVFVDKITGESVWGGSSLYSISIFSINYYNGQRCIDNLNAYLEENGQRALEFVSADNLYKLSDFTDVLQLPFRDVFPETVPNVPDVVFSTSSNPPNSEFILDRYPYLSRLKDNKKYNYAFNAFKPGILLQSAELNEIQERNLLQSSMLVDSVSYWPFIGKRDETANLTDLNKIILSGNLDDVYSFPVPNSNYAYPLIPGTIYVSYIQELLKIYFQAGWYNLPTSFGNYWHYVNETINFSLNIPASSIQDKLIYLQLEEKIITSSYDQSDEGYDFHDKSNKFLNPITDGSDRYKISITNVLSYEDENCKPILRVRKGINSIVQNRILVQTLNNYKIFDINI
jgi:hypothetical protein